MQKEKRLVKSLFIRETKLSPSFTYNNTINPDTVKVSE